MCSSVKHIYISHGAVESGGLISIGQAILKYWKGLMMTLKGILFWGGQPLYYRLAVFFLLSESSDSIPGSWDRRRFCTCPPQLALAALTSAPPPSPRGSVFSLIYCFVLGPEWLPQERNFRHGLFSDDFFYTIGNELLWALHSPWFSLFMTSHCCV